MLNEFSPDICAFETLQRKLKDFRYECRLSSYIGRITQRCTHEWLRSHAALKRGGSGVTSAAQRRADGGCLKSIRFAGDDLQSCRCDSVLASSELLSVVDHSGVSRADGAVGRSPIQRIRMAPAAGRRSVVGPVVKWAAPGSNH